MPKNTVNISEKYLGLMSLVFEYLLPEIASLSKESERRCHIERSAQEKDVFSIQKESYWGAVLSSLEKAITPFKNLLEQVYYRDKNERGGLDAESTSVSRYALLRPQLILSLLMILGKWYTANRSSIAERGYNGWLTLCKIDPKIRQYQSWQYLTDPRHVDYLSFIDLPYDQATVSWEDISSDRAFTFRVGSELSEAQKREAHRLIAKILHMELNRYEKRSEPWNALLLAYQEHQRQFQQYDLRLRTMFMGRYHYDTFVEGFKQFSENIISLNPTNFKYGSVFKKLSARFASAAAELEARIVSVTGSRAFTEEDLALLLQREFVSLAHLFSDISELVLSSRWLAVLLPKFFERIPEKINSEFMPPRLKLFSPLREQEDFTQFLLELLFSATSLANVARQIRTDWVDDTTIDFSNIPTNIEKTASDNKSFSFFVYGIVCLLLVERYRYLQRYLMLSHNSDTDIEPSCQSWLNTAALCFFSAKDSASESEQAQLINGKPYSEWCGFFQKYCVAHSTAFSYDGRLGSDEMAFVCSVDNPDWDPRNAALMVSRVCAPITQNNVEKIQDYLEKYVVEGGGVSGENTVFTDPEKVARYKRCQEMQDRIPQFRNVLSKMESSFLLSEIDDPSLTELIRQLDQMADSYSRYSPDVDFKQHCLTFCRDSFASWRYKTNRSMILLNIGLMIFVAAVAFIATSLIAYFVLNVAYTVNQFLTSILLSSVISNTIVFVANKLINGHFLFMKPADIKIHIDKIIAAVEQHMELSSPLVPLEPPIRRPYSSASRSVAAGLEPYADPERRRGSVSFSITQGSGPPCSNTGTTGTGDSLPIHATAKHGI